MEDDEEQGVAEQAAPVAKPAAEPAESDMDRMLRHRRERDEIIVDLLTAKGLYTSIDTGTDHGEAVETMLREGNSIVFDTYCVGCREGATFRVQTERVASRSIASRPGQTIIEPSLFATKAICQRSYHVYTYVFQKMTNGKLVKIGQHPSTAEVSFGELRSIDKALDPVDRRELGTALGLFAHGTVLGAFVYLRRVFERMIWRAHDRQSEAGNVIDGFSTMRMDERIAALKDELPPSVVQNSGVFSVLSIGIHELTEEQCGKHFPVLKAVLFQMLEQEEHKRKAAITAKETEAALQRILSNPKE